MSEQKKSKIWTVCGEQGQYSDYSMWMVRCFDNEDEAERFAKALNDAIPAAVAAYDKAYATWQALGYKDRTNTNAPRPQHPLDPNATYGLGETSYSVTDVDFGWPEQETAKSS